MELQANGYYTASHNSSITEGILALYDSDGLSKNDALAFITRQIFNSELIKGWRPGALASLDMYEIKKAKTYGE